jgi:23S rRNA G2445 N2-methylase RlmL
MHGYKTTINWGTLRETYACALIYNSNILDNFDKTKKLHVWDPFCGCGTIMFEVLSLALNRHARNIDDISKEAFVHLPFNNKKEFSAFLESERRVARNYTINLPEGTDIHLIASDIESKAITALSKNSIKANFDKFVFKSAEDKKDLGDKINISINPTIYHEKINQIFDAFIGDFETVASEVIFNEKLNFKNKKFVIISNVPYGTSHVMSDKIEIKKLYKRFGKFLRKYESLFEDVYILVNKRNKDDELNFKNLTEIKWEVVDCFDNNSIPVEFLKMQIEK